ncbi:MAG: type II toxin-antitoxin system PemK/MazF family toxin [Clostridia bacterium]|nr:type II toxin-antitoxin system PemK/MazF family toxin [Clostridia bacterium]
MEKKTNQENVQNQAKEIEIKNTEDLRNEPIITTEKIQIIEDNKEEKQKENQKEKEAPVNIIRQQLDETEKILENVENENAYEYVTWTKDKAELKFYGNFPNFHITNNFIYWCNLGINIGSEQNKIRPAIIIRTQANSPICTILPLTSGRLNDDKWYHIDLEQKNSTAMIEQVRNISKLRVLNPLRANGLLSRITPNDFYNINDALGNYYKLQPFPEKNKK